MNPTTERIGRSEGYSVAQYPPDVMDGPGQLGEQATIHLTASEVLDRLFDEAEGTQTLANLSAASTVFAIGEATAWARQFPGLYLRADLGPNGPSREQVDFAERAVVFDLSQRLHLTESVVHGHAHVAETLTESLPRLAAVFRAGLISPGHVHSAVQNVVGISAVMLDRYDEEISSFATVTSGSAFARRCLRLHDRLCADTLQERHDLARAQRRVVLEPSADGMAWLHAYLPAIDAIRIDARLSATATRLRNTGSETRTRAQLKADLFVSWGAGDGTPTAAKVRPYLLLDAGGRYAEAQGYGPVDVRSAATCMRDASAFRRVVTDPVRAARLVLDRRTYRPTRDQRAWLTLHYGLDDQAADYVSFDAEVDHVTEYQHGGATNVTNLIPLKPRLHRLKSVTTIAFAPRPEGGIRITTPTSRISHAPPF